jgi:fumarate hydratase class I
MSDFHHEPIFQLSEDPTTYRKLDAPAIETLNAAGRTILQVPAEALTILATAAMRDIEHLFRPGHLQQWADILKDPKASPNDRFVALELLKNACIAAGFTLPTCQDTGTAIVIGEKGEQVWTDGDDHEALSKGVFKTFAENNLRFSQMAPLSMFEEKNTGTNLPAQIDIYAEKGQEYHFLFIAKGGGSANKTYLYQETRALLNPKNLKAFLQRELPKLGTAACPPYHLALVIGGTSAEMNLKTVKLASCRYLDNLPTSGNAYGRAFRDLEMEKELTEIARNLGIGAQFGGQYFALDARVIRLPRHAASMPIGIGVSCSADRQALAKITSEGVFLEALERNPARFLPEAEEKDLSPEVVEIDLNQPMDQIRQTLSRYPIKTRLSLTGPIIVARDIAHAKIKEMVENGADVPWYFRDHVIYYAGPAKKPQGLPSGSFGPTTAARMDSYIEFFQSRGASLITLAKGNRSPIVRECCKKYGGFYLGSIGGAAAKLAQDVIKKVEVLDFAELGMEAVWRIEVERFPAFIVIDDKGNDFFDVISRSLIAEADA